MIGNGDIRFLNGDRSWLLSSFHVSEWRDGIKMVGNVAAVRTVPGRYQDNHCRYCYNEVETLPHVLGSCPHGEALRNARHHQVRSIIATALKDAEYKTFEEIHGLSVTVSTRRIDIIAFKESTRSGTIIDPTLRFETNKEQPAEVDKEKKNLCNPTIPYHLQKYQLKDLEVIGLLVGARESLYYNYYNFCYYNYYNFYYYNYYNLCYYSYYDLCYYNYYNFCYYNYYNLCYYNYYNLCYYNYYNLCYYNYYNNFCCYYNYYKLLQSLLLQLL
ncbi:hypothetical protein ANN_02601 [Periplaneta americana]|uniref:Reverse transcriptase n=1 Tax=Periplaneta americana TaxID=6978 RepID=A0ABQ8U087_PERAM|nr:hypothetical protein ANN_02601 [Periplaneta americana]